MFGMLLACGVFAFVMGSIDTIVQKSNKNQALTKEKILHVN